MISYTYIRFDVNATAIYSCHCGVISLASALMMAQFEPILDRILGLFDWLVLTQFVLSSWV